MTKELVRFKGPFAIQHPEKVAVGMEGYVAFSSDQGIFVQFLGNKAPIKVSSDEIEFLEPALK